MFRGLYWQCHNVSYSFMEPWNKKKVIWIVSTLLMYTLYCHQRDTGSLVVKVTDIESRVPCEFNLFWAYAVDLTVWSVQGWFLWWVNSWSFSTTSNNLWIWNCNTWLTKYRQMQIFKEKIHVALTELAHYTFSQVVFWFACDYKKCSIEKLSQILFIK
jgi:hypothetical protein